MKHKSESDNNDPSISFNMESPDTSQLQPKVHIAGLKIGVELDSEAYLDIDIGSDGDNSDSNTTIIIDSETKGNTPNKK